MRSSKRRDHNSCDENWTYKPIPSQNQNQVQDEHSNSDSESSFLPSISETEASKSRVGTSSSSDMDARELEHNQKPDENVVSRLEKLHFGVQEPELTEEQIIINDQLQEDELLAMESIFGDNLVTRHKQGELRSFQIYVNLDLPPEFMVMAGFNSPDDLNTKTENTDEFLYSFKVQYLPPIEITCLLPKSYPSHQPPLFTILVKWLDSPKVSRLCSMMDSIWMEQPGQEIIYQWVEWLQNSSLSHLGIDNEITLGPYGIRYGGDTRSASTGISLDVDVPSLMSYNAEHCHENFIKNLHKCLICYNEYAGSDFIRLPCHHFFCLKCLKTYSDIHILEGSVKKLKCPDTKCGDVIPPSFLKQLVSTEAYELWESLTLQKTLDSMSDVEYCPRCQTPCTQDRDHHAQCSKCFFSFCTRCQSRWHVGAECETTETMLQRLQVRQNSPQLIDKQKRKELQMINELLNVKEISRDSKQCPSCKMAIYRTGGCNKMRCSNCGEYFCYRCGHAIRGYDHFGDGSCEMFPQEVIRQWNQMNVRQFMPRAPRVRARPQAPTELDAEHANSCPSCGQLNAKVDNNNHVQCWACQKRFCYLCRKIVKHTSNHFGPKGCKQHTIS
ncbi:NDR1/HIN1-like 8 [Euphorbia peplus]|nr:NDR1/HIN1-like 8 [Euphorbia peplus]